MQQALPLGAKQSAVQLTFLGTGTSQGVPVIGCRCAVCTSTDPRDKRLRSSALVQYNGTTLLLDAGPDLRQQMLREHVQDLDAVLLTHEHMDHVAGMDDLRSFSFAHQPPKDIPIYANARTLDAVKRVYAYAFNNNKYPGIPQFELHQVDTGPFKLNGSEVIPVEVMHRYLPVTAYRIGPMAYVTDAKSIADKEKKKLEGVEVLVVNALRHQEHPSHFNVAEALALVKELGPGRAFFTHISHLMGLHAAMELPAGVELAYDGLRVDI